MEKELDMVTNNYIDEQLNNRIIMIKKDGSIDVLADRSDCDSDEFRHMLYFDEYFNNHYLDDYNLQLHGHNLNGYDAVLFLLSKVHGNIIIIDTSQGKNKNQYGIIQLPCSITNKQEDTFTRLNYVINKYSELLIFAQPMLDDNVPRNGVYKHLKSSDFDEILNYTSVVNTNER